VTGLPLSKVLGSESMEKAMEKLVWIGMVGGLRSFTILNVPAKRALNIYMGIEDEGGVKAKADPLDLPPGIRDDADLATRYFESAVCYMALTDEYAEEIVEGRFLVASTRFARAGYIDAAAMSSDLASRWWRPAPFKVPGEHQNPYHKQAAKLFAESLVRDPDAFTFGTRYLYGLYHAKKASDFATMQRFFGASSGYFKAMHNTYEAARAHIRQLWAFTQRRDIEAADWLAISGDLSSAIDLFTDSWLERDAKAVAKLRELSAMAIRLSGTT